MVFHFKESTLEAPFGRKLVGMQRDGERPFAVTLTREEVNKLITTPGYIYALRNWLKELPK